MNDYFRYLADRIRDRCRRRCWCWRGRQRSNARRASPGRLDPTPRSCFRSRKLNRLFFGSAAVLAAVRCAVRPSAVARYSPVTLSLWSWSTRPKSRVVRQGLPSFAVPSGGTASPGTRSRRWPLEEGGGVAVRELAEGLAGRAVDATRGAGAAQGEGASVEAEPDADHGRPRQRRHDGRDGGLCTAVDDQRVVDGDRAGGHAAVDDRGLDEHRLVGVRLVAGTLQRRANRWLQRGDVSCYREGSEGRVSLARK